MKFYGQWNPSEDEVAYRNYFSDKKQPGFFIECGAGPHGAACKSFEANLNWGGLYIEASPLFFNALERDTKTDSRIRILWKGLSNKNGVATFKEIISARGGGGDNGSFEHHPEHLKELIGYGCVFNPVEVEICTYATLIESSEYITDVTFLSLDVEGHELQVLDGMKGASILPEVMSIEYPISGFDNVKGMAEDLGYKFNFVSFNNAFFSHVDKEEWWGATGRMKDL